MINGKAYSLTMVRDISERKAAQRKMAELQFAVENATEGLYVIEESGRIIHINKHVRDQLGYSDAEIIGKFVMDIDPDMALEYWRESWQVAMDYAKAGRQRLLESRHRRKDGTIFPVEVSIYHAEFEGSGYHFTFVRDITERKRTEEELRKYREHLEELVESRTAELRRTQEKLVQKEKLAVLGQLTGVVRHELRNPLGTIRSSIYLLRDKLNKKSEIAERAIARAERNIARCDQIIEELLDYARAPQTIKRSVALDGWLADVLEDYAVPGDITVKTELDAGVNVALDTDRFERCIINVLANVCEALRETESTPKLVHVQTRAADNVEIRINDNGPGIAERCRG
jgi:PAS domain S-box-containing protein